MSEWFECPEKLPEDNQAIIFMEDDLELCYCGIFAHKFRTPIKGGGHNDYEMVFVENYDLGVFQISDIAYWMPLPERPVIDRSKWGHGWMG